MSNGYKLELLPMHDDDGNTGAFLSYWDATHGEDVIFKILPDGTVSRNGQSITDLNRAILDLVNRLYSGDAQS